MNPSRIIIPSAWALSLATAFVIGGKIQNSDQPSANSTDDSSNRSSRRHSAAVSNNSSYASQRRAGSRGKSSRNSSARQEELNITSITRNSDPIARANDLLALIDQLGPNDFPQVIADFRALGITRDRMSEYGMLLHAWAKADPLGALDYAEQNTGTPFARQTILTSWAASDPNAALSWAENHHEGEGANPWLVGIIQGVATTDPARATEILNTMPFSRERGEALGSLVPYIARQGAEASREWLNSLEDDRLRSGATSRIASTLARQDPAKAAEWITTLDDEKAQSSAIPQVAGAWARQDLDASVQWVDGLAGSDKTNAARQIIGQYISENPTQATAWLQSLSSEEGYEGVVQSYIWQTARRNPELSLAQVPEIKDERSQNRYYERILRTWHSQNAEAATQWMDNNAVSDELRQQVLRPNRNNLRRRGGR